MTSKKLEVVIYKWLVLLIILVCMYGMYSIYVYTYYIPNSLYIYGFNTKI